MNIIDTRITKIIILQLVMIAMTIFVHNLKAVTLKINAIITVYTSNVMTYFVVKPYPIEIYVYHEYNYNEDYCFKVTLPF